MFGVEVCQHILDVFYLVWEGWIWVIKRKWVQHVAEGFLFLFLDVCNFFAVKALLAKNTFPHSTCSTKSDQIKLNVIRCKFSLATNLSFHCTVSLFNNATLKSVASDVGSYVANYCTLPLASQVHEQTTVVNMRSPYHWSVVHNMYNKSIFTCTSDKLSELHSNCYPLQK